MSVPTAPEFCKADDVRQLFNLPPQTPTERFQRHIRMLSATVSKVCRRKFVRQEYVEFCDAPHRVSYDHPLTLFMPEKPFLQSAPLTVYYDPLIVDWTQLSPLVLGKDYAVDYERGEITILKDMCRKKRAFKITYTGGYACDTDSANPNYVDVPEDLRGACAQQVWYNYERFANKQVGATQVSTDDKVVDLAMTTVQGFLPDVTQIVMSYRHTI